MSSSVELPFAPLDSQCNEARVTPISWQSYFENGMISADEMAVMEELSIKSNWTELFIKEGTVYLSVPLSVLGKVEDIEAALVCLTIIYDILVQHPQKSTMIISDPSFVSLHTLQSRVLSGDELVAGHAARILAIIAFLMKDLAAKDAELLIQWINASLRMYPEREQRVLLGTLLLEHVLRVPRMRELFSSDNDESLRLLVTSLAKSRNVQIQYQSIFAIWLLSFDTKVAQLLQTRFNLIPTLLDVSKGAIKEKVIRLCISTWRNLLARCPSVAVPVMIGAKVLDYLEAISEGRIADEEVLADIAVLKEELLRAYQSLNSFDEYASEIKSGKLEWSPPHKSELFWKDNANRLAEADLEILRLLSKLLEPHNDPQILAIAANDVGMYVSHHTCGRRNIEQTGIKQKIMSLISHPDPEVRFHALTAMQKYMKKLWNPA